MKDVVAITATDKRGTKVAFMTWGRLFDPIDDSELLRTVKEHSHAFMGAPMRKFAVCDSLRDVSRHHYFHEALLHFAWQPIPFGEQYKTWQQRKRRKLVGSGTDIYFLGAIRAEVSKDLYKGTRGS